MTRKVVQNTRPSFSHVRGGAGHETRPRYEADSLPAWCALGCAKEYILLFLSIHYTGFRRYIPKPVTTPSANKNFSRYKTQMIQELFELFNSTVFENKVRSRQHKAFV